MSFTFQPMVLRPSRYHQFYIVVIHVLVAGLPWLSAAPCWSCVLLTLVVCAAACYQVRRYRDEFPCTLSYRDGNWFMRGANNEQPAVLEGGTWITPELTVLALRLHDGVRWRVALWPDTAPTNDIRRVRVLLRNQKSK